MNAIGILYVSEKSHFQWQGNVSIVTEICQWSKTLTESQKLRKFGVHVRYKQ